MNKVVNICKTLPQGDILVFLTGKREILTFCIDLENELAKIKSGSTGEN